MKRLTPTLEPLEQRQPPSGGITPPPPVVAIVAATVAPGPKPITK